MTGISGMTTCTIGSPTCTGVPVGAGEASKRFAEVISTKLGATEAQGFEMSASGKSNSKGSRGV